MNKPFNIFPGFGGSKAPAPLPPPPKIDDPAVTEAKEKLRLSEKKRRGRRASILTGDQEDGIIKRSSALGVIGSGRSTASGL